MKICWKFSFAPMLRSLRWARTISGYFWLYSRTISRVPSVEQSSPMTSSNGKSAFCMRTLSRAWAMNFRSDDLGILLAVFPHDFPRAIGRAIIPDDQLERKIGLLHEDALKGLGDEFLMVIRDHENADLQLGVRDVDIGHCALMPFSHESKSVVNPRRHTGRAAHTRDSGSAAGSCIAGKWRIMRKMGDRLVMTRLVRREAAGLD